MSYISKNPYASSRPANSMIGKSLLTSGLIALLFGIAILINPDLIAYLVASFFIFVGLSLLGMWWNMRK